MKNLVTWTLLMALPAGAPVEDTALSYSLDRPAKVSLGIYDSRGALVRTLLSGEAREAGSHTLTWDGLDRNGRPAPPATYEWRLFASDGLKAEFLLGLGINPEWPVYEEWLGNHDGTSATAVDGEGNVYVAAASGEGAAVLLRMTPDGKRKLWSRGQIDIADGVERLAIIGSTVFVMQKNKKIFALDPATGAVRGNKPFVNALHPEDRAWTWENRIKNPRVSPMDLEAVGDEIAISYRDYNFVRFVSAKDPSVTRDVPVKRPGALAAGPKGVLYVAGEGAVFAVDPAGSTAREEIHDGDLRSPVGMTWEPQGGDLLVAVRGPGGHHLRRYRDRRLTAVHGRPEGRHWGAYEPGDFHGLLDVQADGRGGYFTVERVPRRVAHWSAGRPEKPVREWFGGINWGAMLTLDPEDPSVAFFHMEQGAADQFMRAKLDFRTRRWTLTHVYERMPFPQPVELGHPRWRLLRRGGRTYFVNFGDHFFARYPMVVLELLSGGTQLRMASFLARLDTQKFEWWQEAAQREGLQLGGGWVGAGWTDANGDGRIQGAEVRPSLRTIGSGHVWLDRDWNLFVSGSDQREQKVDADGRAVMWYKVPNRAARAEDLPAWDWRDAQPVKAEAPDEILRWRFPEMMGLALDEEGSVYQMTRPSYRVGADPKTRELREERHGDGWPHIYGATARLFKWRADGTLEWAAGRKANVKAAEQPGELACPVAFLGFAGDKVFVHDRAGRVATAWTRDGLYAGYVFDRHLEDGLSAQKVYHVTGKVVGGSGKPWLMGDDHVIQNFTLAADGQVYWATPAEGSVALYRVHDWKGGTRKGGTIEIKSPGRPAALTGSGLKAEYFAGPDPTGDPALVRVDDQVWFRGSWLAYAGEIKAPPFFAVSSPMPDRRFSARWTGEIEARFAEDYRLGVSLQAHPSGRGIWRGSRARLWIDGRLVVDHWENVVAKAEDPPRTDVFLSPPVPLRPGKRVPLRLEFSANEAAMPHVHLVWESRTQDREHVPAAALYHLR